MNVHNYFKILSTHLILLKKKREVLCFSRASYIHVHSVNKKSRNGVMHNQLLLFLCCSVQKLNANLKPSVAFKGDCLFVVDSLFMFIVATIVLLVFSAKSFCYAALSVQPSKYTVVHEGNSI